MNFIRSIAAILTFVSAFSISTQAQTEPKKTDTVEIQTSAICGMCKDKIEHDLSFEKGVKWVSLDNDSKVVTVVYKPAKTTQDKIKKAISEIGYDADDVKADQEAHDKLPACCQKGTDPH